MKNLFKNKKQKTVWVICVILILFNMLNLTDDYADPTSVFLLPVIGFVIVSFILAAILQDK